MGAQADKRSEAASEPASASGLDADYSAPPDRSLLHQRLVRALWESAAVLGAIIAALALEAWWTDRSERIAAYEELEQVAVDLAENVRLIEQELVREERIARGVADFQSRVAAAANGEVVEVPDTVLTAFLYHPTYDPIVASMERLLSSGHLPLIGDRELQTALTRWPTELEQMSESTVLQRRGVVEHIFPFFIERDINLERAVKLRELWFPAQVTPEAGQYHTLVPVSDGLRTLIAERESEVYWLRRRTQNVREFQVDLLEQVQDELR